MVTVRDRVTGDKLSDGAGIVTIDSQVTGQLGDRHRDGAGTVMGNRQGGGEQIW